MGAAARGGGYMHAASCKAGVQHTRPEAVLVATTADDSL